MWRPTIQITDPINTPHSILSHNDLNQNEALFLNLLHLHLLVLKKSIPSHLQSFNEIVGEYFIIMKYTDAKL